MQTLFQVCYYERHSICFFSYRDIVLTCLVALGLFLVVWTNSSLMFIATPQNIQRFHAPPKV